MGMKTAILCVSSLLSLSLLATAAQTPGGFREMLEIVGIEPALLNAIDANQPTAEDWQIVAQIVARLDQYASSLDRWTRKDPQFAAGETGELFDLAGTVKQVDKLAAPAGVELPQLYRCQLELAEGRQALVLSVQVPKRWELGKPLQEPVSLRGVLLGANESPVFLTTHLSWFPRAGLPLGQLLLSRFGMDATLWDDIVQRSVFVSPDRGRESQAFYAILTAIAKIPTAELATIALQSIADNARAARLDSGTKVERQVAAAVAERAARNLSSVAPLFLNPEAQVGQLIRIEGIARRAVRIVADPFPNGQSLSEYYELEVFTDDSQNLPIVCLVARLPAGFPTGDAIRAGVRVDGVFFKLWQYHSRETKQSPGETTTLQASYTPIVMAASVTWLKQSTTMKSWWGLAVGGIVFVLVMVGFWRMLLSSRKPTRLSQEDLPDFSQLQD
jgi:hypothetical protein